MVRRASAGVPEVTYTESSNRFHAWLSALPQGSFKVFVGAVIAIAMTLAVILAPFAEAVLCMIRFRWVPQVPQAVACSHLEIPEGALWALVGVIAGFIGGSSWDFATKRGTYKPSPPAALDIEDVRAGATVTQGATGVENVPMSRKGDAGVVADGRTSAKDDPGRGFDDDGNRV